MQGHSRIPKQGWANALAFIFCLLGTIAGLLPMDAQAIPLFARQTGQNCVACHAGGQFPELTAYGRKFKLTGYTLGVRADVPLAVMGTLSGTSVNNKTPGSGDVNADFPQDGLVHFTTASIFAGGKITDNIGLFGQWTYNAYDHQSGADQHWTGHSTSDQFDLRYADRFIDTKQDLIVGASLNNNPGVTDVWNTFNSAFGSIGPGYVPISNPGGAGPFIGASATPAMLGMGPTAAGLNAYVYWNDTVYAEIGAYQTANRIFSFMSQGIPDSAMPKLKGNFNPYWRLALNHDWGANSAMVGLFGMNSEVYYDSPATSGPTTRYRDIGVDAQYQYILDPHTITAQFSYIRENQSYSDELWDSANPNYGGNYANSSNTLDYLRLKATYVYQAKYGASLGYVSATGSADALAYTNSSTGNPVPFGNANSTPNTKIWIPEIFWTPIQNVRIGLQYYKFTEYNGSSSNYDGNGRNASDNDTLVFYVWGAF